METHTYFDTLDYSVFGMMLLLSALIGVYFAFCAKQKQNTTKEYLMGGKTMGIFPISMSMIASYISGIALMGMPSEIYVYGTQYWMLVIGEVVTTVVMATVYIPVFYTLQITSSYEYLKVRFKSSHVRTLGSFLFCMKMLLYIPIVIYVPALAFAQVTGFSLYLLIPIISFVCIFYTTLGGLKAVVWTDTLQMVLMIAGTVVVMFMGTADVGGFKEVWKRNSEGGRIEFFNMDMDPTIRHTFWNILIGKFFSHLASCTVNQSMVQRCLALSSLKKARMTIVYFTIGISGLVSVCCYTGMIIYAAFHKCDPVLSGNITKHDQLLPYFVMKITSHVPALPGIFLAGVFSAALSTMSTGLNSLTGVIYHDFLRPCQRKSVSEARASLIMKIIVLVLGVLVVALAFVVDKLGGLIQTSGSLAGITAGTLLGMFTLGMLFPWANAKGAIAGGVVSFIFVGWVSLGTQLAINNKQIVFPKKPMLTEGCDNATLAAFELTQSSMSQFVEEVREKPFPLYTMSYTYYTPVGVLTAIVVGLIVSFLTGPNKPENMDIDLFSPCIHRYIKSCKQRRKESILVEEQNLEQKRFSNGATKTLIKK